jgi:hypothetical protein
MQAQPTTIDAFAKFASVPTIMPAAASSALSDYRVGEDIFVNLDGVDGRVVVIGHGE